MLVAIWFGEEKVIYVTWVKRQVILSSENGFVNLKKTVQQWTNLFRDDQGRQKLKRRVRTTDRA